MRLRRHVRGVAVAIAAVGLLVVTVAAGPGAGAGAAPGADVTPATGGRGVPVIPGFTQFDPAVVGYQLSEFFLAGTAHAYSPATPLGTDGRFDVVASSSAPFTTRVVGMRPAKASRFNGTVVVEWLNVSGGADAGPDWILAHNQLIRDGFAWVGVSAQKVGVDALKGTDPQRGDAERYAGLSHPGDSYSYDIFSQAGAAIRQDARTVLGGLHPRHLIAAGESQSAARMVTYIDAVHPLAHVYDGFLVHSRAAAGSPLSQPPLASVPVPSPTPIRTDLDVPVLVFQTETDVSLSNATAHFDFYGLAIGMTDTGNGQGGIAMLDSMQHPTNQPNPLFTCNVPINTGPAHWVLDAAFHQLGRWVADGVPPPIAPRLQVTGTSPVTFATDANGNVLGGIRTPAVDAPVATLSGLPQGGSPFCVLFGTTVPLTADQLAALYPNHGTFVADTARSAIVNTLRGFIVPADAVEQIVAA